MRPRSWLSRATGALRGFTFFEVALAIVVFLIGLAGMGTMALAAVRSATDASDRTQALELADRSLRMIEAEAVGWNKATWDTANETPDLDTYMPLIKEGLPSPPVTGGTNDFRELTQDLPGNDTSFAYTRHWTLVDPSDETARYCVHYRLTWLQVLNLGGTPSPESFRAEVRVYWRRRDTAPGSYNFNVNCGSAAADIAAMAADKTVLSKVAIATVVSRNALKAAQ